MKWSACKWNAEKWKNKPNLDQENQLKSANWVAWKEEDNVQNEYRKD